MANRIAGVIFTVLGVLFFASCIYGLIDVNVFDSMRSLIVGFVMAVSFLAGGIYLIVNNRKVS